ncbi:methionine biosynthesis protein MetW [Methylotenera sp.]|jgi:methionine biosynthesis protein MetW|uniref:methionine biosynthesis protein MetW n=1 Tax=Methylotenera sp. TaxID=2051956 RepID=UPI00271F5730|nr:methionine biosynthesis protein MetW [Methylotenera sp.]MDO9205417.1 methionine biosynthesis protein MetW [Methylotenera sp.]MDO9393716.1 methionine biosynthesis protein MetW [Methylotenera sp.]MDP1523430.1 methionine biosynthesis protein MetW [Methylotenera sp.]MDP2070568.1 methionine biosynthesis protein MetW [Methylotenera sp.]MDP2229701.1 methionine biosynthesis protein MetW [Methylotenera sp.]
MQNNVKITNIVGEFRQDFAIIANWVKFGSKVLDLGCGDGELLQFLRKSLEVKGYGVEKDDANWLACMKNGSNVIQMDLEDGLSGFEDQSFDTVILSQTLQAMHNTEEIVQEMLRVGREIIVTFPNFGYWRNRIQITGGRMPVSKTLPYQWYDTPNVHLCTINDFDQFCKNHKITILERKVITDGSEVGFMPNLFGNLAMYRLKTS